MLLSVITAVAALAGCGSSASKSTGSSTTAGGSSTAGGTKAAKVAFLTFILNSYTNAEADGITKTAGGTMTRFASNADPQQQLQQCQNAVSSGRYNAIVVETPDGASGVPCARIAAAAKIPVFATTFPIGKNLNQVNPQTPGVIGQVVYNLKQHAEIAYAAIKQACQGHDPCNVIQEIVSPGYVLDTADEAYIKAHASEAPHIRIVAKSVGGYNPGLTAKNLPQVIGSNPDVNVIKTEADFNADAAAKVLQKLGKKNVMVVAEGFSKASPPDLKNGLTFATMVELPNTNGERIGDMIKAYLAGKPVPPSTSLYDLVPSHQQIVTKANLGSLTPQY
jgi:ribose transport system substrate-binding protein